MLNRLMPAALAFAVAATLPVAASARTSAVPHCPGGNPSTSAGHGNCYVPRVALPAGYAKPFSLTLLHLTKKWVPNSPSTGYGHWTYVATFRFQSELKACPVPTPISAIPCQQSGVSLGIVGRYVPGAKTLQGGVSGSMPSQGCPGAEGTCPVTFVIYPELIHGKVSLIFALHAIQYVTFPGNNLGTGGAEYPLTLSIPYVKPPG